MDKMRLIYLVVVTAAIGSFATVALTNSADRDLPRSDIDIDIEALLGDIQKVSSNLEVADLVWWLPIEYFQAMGQEPADEMSFRDLEEALSPYTLVAVQWGRLLPSGHITWIDSSRLRKGVALVDADGKEYRPYPDEDVSDVARSVVEGMKQAFTAADPEGGPNLYFFFFPANTVSGRRIADPRQEGSFSIRMEKVTYEWRLPLGSFLPPRKCPVDGEQMPGNWRFCPWHGKELVAVD